MPNTSSIAAITIQSELNHLHKEFIKNEKRRRSCPAISKIEVKKNDDPVETLMHFKPLFKNQELRPNELEPNECVSSFKILNNGSIKCIIYVKKTAPSSTGKRRSSIFSEIPNLFRKEKKIENDSEKCDPGAFQKLDGHVDLVWSVDSWKSWNSTRASYMEQTNDFFIYEALLSKASDLLPLNETIEFLSCYINESGLYKDTNQGKLYAFQRVDKRIILGH